jgi:hypothetical protein
MAREAGFDLDGMSNMLYTVRGNHAQLALFETLVRADEREEANCRANASWTLMCEKMVVAEREACAKVCDDYFGFNAIADAIRARGTHD